MSTTTAPAPATYDPAPGTEYPFSISDIARATARLLGDGWTAESGFWGVTGAVSGPYVTDFEFVVDYEGDLCIRYARYEEDGFPEHPEGLPDDVAAYSEGVTFQYASAADGLAALAEKAAAAIRAIPGR